MNPEKLFKVLVLGGALIATGTLNAQEVTSDISNEISTEASTQEAASFFEQIVQVKAEGKLTFCKKQNPQQCEQGADGVWKAKPGLVCCWNTSCQ